MKLSVNFIVCNEATRLPAAIADARQYADEIVVVVQESTDDSLATARELADVVIAHPCYGYCEPSRRAAHDASSGDWILNLDADERLTDYGRSVLPSLMSDTLDFYRLRRLTVVGGRVIEDMPHGRLFRKGKATISADIHTQYWPATDLAVDVAAEPVILHDKTIQEQHEDDLRYRAILPNYPMRV